MDGHLMNAILTLSHVEGAATSDRLSEFDSLLGLGKFRADLHRVKVLAYCVDCHSRLTLTFRERYERL